MSTMACTCADGRHMQSVGCVESIWRYPVKSMRGEELALAYVGKGGLSGDRCYAFGSTAAPAALPYLTSRAQEKMLLYRPHFLPADVTPGGRQPTGAPVEVETPCGERLSIKDPRLLKLLTTALRQQHTLSLVKSDRALADEQPVSLLSVQTARQLSDELRMPVDKRRFRANIYADLESSAGFREDAFVGHTLRIGSEVTLSIVKRDPRCKIITLDPDTSEANPEIIRHVAAAHERCAGVYATVDVPGTIRPGDKIVLVGRSGKPANSAEEDTAQAASRL